jgi:hypothetical protein
MASVFLELQRIGIFMNLTPKVNLIKYIISTVLKILDFLIRPISRIPKFLWSTANRFLPRLEARAGV